VTGSGLGDAGLVALIAIVPLVVLMLTCFVKVSVVLSLLRNAIGATDAPSGLVVMGVSLVLTLFVMAPVAVEMVTAAGTQPTAPAPVTPVTAFDAALRQLVPGDQHDELAAFERSLVPLRGFLAKHAGATDRETFVELSEQMGHPAKGDELSVLAPAFLTTELKEAFAIAVLLFIPFLVLDLIVGLGLSALGMSMTNPQVVALPLKLLLFVSVDGWRLLIDALLRGYV